MKFSTLSILIFVLTISLVLNEEVTRKKRNRNTIVKIVKRLIDKIRKNDYTYSMEDIQKISEIKEKVSKGSLNRRLKKKLIRVLSKMKSILLQNMKNKNQGMMRLGRKEIQQLKKVLRMLNFKKRNNVQRKNNLRKRNRKGYNKKNNREERESKYNDNRRGGQDKESLKEYVDKKVKKEVRKKLSKEIKNRRKNRKHLRRIKTLKRTIHHIRNNSNNECKENKSQSNYNRNNNYNSNYHYQNFNQNNQPNCNDNNNNYNTNNNNYSGNNNILPPSSTNIIAAVPILPVPLPHPIATEIASSPSQGLVQVTKEIPTGIIQETKAILL